jgi:hypothetical protein
MKKDGNLVLTSGTLKFALNLQLFAEDDTQQVTPPTNPEENTQLENKVPEGNPNENDGKPTDRTFTRSEVTEILKKRLVRAKSKLLAKFGIESEDKLDEYLENHNKTIKDLEDSNNKYGELDVQYKKLFHDYLYLKNDVIPEKYADLDKYFENSELNEENLAGILKSHPEFVKPKQAIPQQIGQQQNGQQSKVTEKELAEKLLGVKL